MLLTRSLLYLWQLPQNLVGLCYKLILRGEKKILSQKGSTFYIAPTMSGGVSFGKYIFLSPGNTLVESVYDHEYGHSIQSRILGPLYLPIIGLSSGIHALLHDKTKNYYHFWTERWANKLGGIEGYKGEYHFHKEGVIHTVFSELKSIYEKYRS